MTTTQRTDRGGSRATVLNGCWKYILMLAMTTFGLTSGGAFAANCNITTMPTPANITVGQSVQFSGNVSGKSPYTYSWTFAGGDPAISSQDSVSVTYNSTGSFQATLDGTNSGNKNTTCSASVTVNVTAGGGNQAPTLDPIGDKTVAEGDSLAFSVTASDPDGPAPIVLTASPLPPGASFTDNGDGTGDFSWPERRSGQQL